MEDVIFAISKVGASHLPLQMPCQDYSLCYKSEDESLRMIIVCDGHGSKTYVRSDVGARLAAEIAKQEVVDFCRNDAAELFKNKKGAATTHPNTEDLLWDKVKNDDEIGDDEKNLREQDKSFSEQVDGIEEQDKRMCLLFNSICTKWKDAIDKDSEENPFSEDEKNALGNNRLAKAYGTTLMVYAETKSCWFSFHIGDGRIVSVDTYGEMSNPVPWDCRCFLNMTTSLCAENPVELFRYAFDGTGAFPKAVFCCSDGIEDSYGNYEASPERLHKFYAGLLNKFSTDGTETTMHNIEEFLPVLSEKGSKDDMSLAGIIHNEEIHVDAITETDSIQDEMPVENNKEGWLKKFTQKVTDIFK